MKNLRSYNENQDNSFFFSQDESSHWYMIPTSLKSRWRELNSIVDDGVDDDADDLIESEFRQYRTGGGIENISFENPKKINTMKHLNKFNEAKKSGTNCPECGEKLETYYKVYCPKCDIQEIIKHKRGSYCLMPILDYGERYIEGFDKDLIWDSFCESDGFHNDSYQEFCVDEDDASQMLKLVLDELGIDCETDNEVLFWVSW